MHTFAASELAEQRTIRLLSNASSAKRLVDDHQEYIPENALCDFVIGTGCELGALFNLPDLCLKDRHR
jgi:hypothetical protein